MHTSFDTIFDASHNGAAQQAGPHRLMLLSGCMHPVLHPVFVKENASNSSQKLDLLSATTLYVYIYKIY